MTARSIHPPTAAPASRRYAARAAGAVGAIVVLALPFAGHAAAASTPRVDVAALESALAALPGVNAIQAQRLANDLNSVAGGGSPTTLGTDLNNILGTIASDSGDSQLLQSVEDAIHNLVGGTSTPADIDDVISQLETVANQSGLPATVTNAADQLVDGLTAANLEQLLGQSGSPLSSQAIQAIIDELDALQGLEPNANVPAGALSALASALDTIASQPGVPAAAATTLEDVAGTLDSGGPVSPSTIAAAVPALSGAVPSLDSVPVTGPALGSIVGTLGTELEASPPGNGGSGGAGGPGGTGSTSSTSGGTSAAAIPGAKVGARINKLAFKGGKLRVALNCPATLTGGCHTTVYLHVGSWRDAIATVTMKAGKTRTVVAGLPHLATTAARNHRLTVTVTATTGSFNTNNHTIRIRVAAKSKSKTK
jgi:hypothetical protein